MAEKKKNLSEYKQPVVESAGSLHIGILVSEWNEEITNALCEGALTTLKENGVKEENIHIYYVPGSFELPLAAKFLSHCSNIHAIICLGCVIQGETRHFEFISQAVANGITQVGIETNVPVIFGILTTDNYQQAQERAGGKHGNKGVEAAIAAIKMIGLQKKLAGGSSIQEFIKK
jgi:6,7-dimethyl-8-ribityllumazine synthase